MEKTFMKEIFLGLCVLLFIVQLQTTAAATSNDTGDVKMKGMYIPVMFRTSEPPTFICHHFRKVCYLPGIASGWRSWYRKGFSGYLVHESWLYYVSKVHCPCLFPEPPRPSTEIIGHATK